MVSAYFHAKYALMMVRSAVDRIALLKITSAIEPLKKTAPPSLAAVATPIAGVA